MDATTLTNSGSSFGSLAPYPASAMPVLPSALANTPGTTNVTVAQGQQQTLNPGSFGTLTDNGIVFLNPGTYSFASVTLGNNAQLVAQSGGATSVSIGGTLSPARARRSSRPVKRQAISPSRWPETTETTARLLRRRSAQAPNRRLGQRAARNSFLREQRARHGRVRGFPHFHRQQRDADLPDGVFAHKPAIRASGDRRRHAGGGSDIAAHGNAPRRQRPDPRRRAASAGQRRSRIGVSPDSKRSSTSSRRTPRSRA